MDKQTQILEPSPTDSRALRHALGTFLTGVTVATTVDASGRPRGLTANSFTSVSLDPPLVLVCIAKQAESYDAFLQSEGFAVNILAESQKSASQLFASKSPEKFDGMQWRPGVAGAPILGESLAWFDCRSYRQVDAGDHLVLIGEVMRFCANPGRPLGYCQGNYVSFGLIDELTERTPGAKVIFGCIVKHRDSVLLCRASPGDPWSLPTTMQANGPAGDQKTLLDVLDQMGIAADMSFLYSVFEVPERNETHIFYRGTLLAAPRAATAAEARLFETADIPWDDLPLSQTRSMLRRYIREQAADNFGIYMDGLGDQRVAMLGGAPEPWQPG